mgnify:CR=1 FL=1
MKSPARSNEPLLVQALEEAIFYRQALLAGELGSVKGFESEDRARIREYRKLLAHARGRTIRRRRNGNPHPGEVR